METKSESTGHANSLADRHESSSDNNGKHDVKYAFAFKQLDWDEYHLHRPTYPESMWNMFFDYHKRHGGAFNVAHDVGTGTCSILGDLRQETPCSTPKALPDPY